MKLITWNTTTCPTAYGGGSPQCPSALWFWVALAVAGVLAISTRKRRSA